MRFLLDQDVPDDVAFALQTMGHEVIKLRQAVPVTTSDKEVLRLAGQRDAVLITCNRDDFLSLVQHGPHRGIIILIRRKSRAQERAALIRLVDKACEAGLRGNINFA